MDFLRYCELIIGPLADWQGGGSTGEAIRIVADGTNQNLRVAFNASKTIAGSPNKIDIAVWGLSQRTIQSIRGNLSRVQIMAGYLSSGSSAGLVASGAILAVIPERQGPDIVLKMTALDGYGGMVRGAYSRAFAGQTPVASVVSDVASALPGVTVGLIDVDGNLFQKGQQLSGSTTDQLNKLADQYGFSWSVQDGIFQAVSDKRDTGREFLFTSERNLISAVPLLNGPTADNVGVEITAKFDARMKPGDRMTIQSAVNPSLNGSYKSTSVNLSFDSHGAASLRAQSLKVPPQ
ncbi:hypothetical protein D3C85_464630 [compost metagenome]